jgi:alkanesulfonate monooxygenase SsuD/methylene tetrahydromethanopterin reductase-like flavin-dependent oxidoreductase (luciferase family)
LLAGETLTQTGSFNFDGVKLTHPIESVPLYAGVIGPKSLSLSGEIADGTVITVMSGPKYVSHAREITTLSATAAGRVGKHELPTLTLVFVDRDGKVARRAARQAVAQMLADAGPDILTSMYGIDAALSDMLARGGAQVLMEEMPEEWIDWFAAAGDPDQCLDRIRALAGAGATSVVLTLTDPGTVESSIDLLGGLIAR